MLDRLLKSKNLKNSYWIIGEQIFQVFLGLVVGMITARYLGPSNYGTLNYTASFVAFFVTIASLSMEDVAISKLISNPNKEGEYLGSCIVFRLISSLLSIIAILILICLLNPCDKVKLILAFLQSVQLLFKAFNILNVWFQRYLKSKYTSIIGGIAYIIISSYKIYLLLTGKSIFWFAFSNSLSDLVIAILLLVFYKIQNGPKLKFDVKIGYNVLKSSYHFILSNILSAIFQYIDKIMISKQMSDADVGFYTAAATIASMWSFIPSAITKSFRPSIMELKEEGREYLYERRLSQLYSVIIWIGITFSVVVTVFSRIGIMILYGDEYIPAVGALKILTWGQVFASASVARGIWIVCENKNQYAKLYVAIGSALNVVLNLLLIPYLGINGASYATTFTQVVVCLIAPAFYTKTRYSSKMLFEAFILKWWWCKKKNTNMNS